MTEIPYLKEPDAYQAAIASPGKQKSRPSQTLSTFAALIFIASLVGGILVGDAFKSVDLYDERSFNFGPAFAVWGNGIVWTMLFWGLAKIAEMLEAAR